MSEHCPECRSVHDVEPWCSGCGHEAELARVISLCTHAVAGDCLEAAVRRELSYLSSELLLAQKELAALRAALAVAEEMAELLLTLSDPEYLPRIRELANGAVTRFHAEREKVGK